MGMALAVGSNVGEYCKWLITALFALVWLIPGHSRLLFIYYSVNEEKHHLSDFGIPAPYHGVQKLAPFDDEQCITQTSFYGRRLYQIISVCDTPSQRRSRLFLCDFLLRKLLGIWYAMFPQGYIVMPRRTQGLPEHFRQHEEAIAKAIGDRIRQRRTQLQLTQDDLLARVEVNEVHISHTQFSRIENGHLLANAAEIIALAAALNVTCSWLLLGHEEAGT
jgi:DNA-binding XRE family transcriptional regulator